MIILVPLTIPLMQSMNAKDAVNTAMYPKVTARRKSSLKMIFNVSGHIDMIRNETKTQTRRLNRGIYQVGKDYAVQRKRGIKAEPNIRIVMDRIWKEERSLTHLGLRMLINQQDAWAEGGYTPEQYEKVFRDIDPKWNGWSRWAFEFHVIEVKE